MEIVYKDIHEFTKADDASPMFITSQCPFNAKYVPVLEAVAKEQGVPFRAIHLQSKSEAQNAPTPITTYAFFRDGEYLTNEQMNDKRFLKVIND